MCVLSIHEVNLDLKWKEPKHAWSWPSSFLVLWAYPEDYQRPWYAYYQFGSFKTATLDGEMWQNINVIKKIKDLIPELPHFHELLAFFNEAAQTWERFTSKFALGGLIDEATTEEKELPWLSASNDENEGALGSFWLLMCCQPQLTQLDYNAISMYFQNNTKAFMVAKFTEEEDYQYLHKLAWNANGMEKKRCRELVVVFASSVLWTKKIHRTELNWIMVWSIFQLRLPKFGVILVASCLISKIIQNCSKTGWNQLQLVKRSHALHSLVTTFITFNLIFGSSKMVKNWERYN